MISNNLTSVNRIKMRKDLHNFRYRGIHVSIHWTFILILIWFAIANLLTGFNSTGWIWSLIMLFSLMISILAHDLAQSVVGTIYGMKINRVIIMPIGGLPSISTKPKKKFYELLMLAAGPAANLSIAAFLFYFRHQAARISCVSLYVQGRQGSRGRDECPGIFRPAGR